MLLLVNHTKKIQKFKVFKIIVMVYDKKLVGDINEMCWPHSAVPKDKDRQCFKLRQGIDKKIVICVQQTANKELAIER